jgi:hypothetical protein
VPQPDTLLSAPRNWTYNPNAEIGISSVCVQLFSVQEKMNVLFFSFFFADAYFGVFVIL